MTKTYFKRQKDTAAVSAPELIQRARVKCRKKFLRSAALMASISMLRRFCKRNESHSHLIMPKKCSISSFRWELFNSAGPPPFSANVLSSPTNFDELVSGLGVIQVLRRGIAFIMDGTLEKEDQLLFACCMMPVAPNFETENTVLRDY
jgi:hypothetical protein